MGSGENPAYSSASGVLGIKSAGFNIVLCAKISSIFEGSALNTSASGFVEELDVSAELAEGVVAETVVLGVTAGNWDAEIGVGITAAAGVVKSAGAGVVVNAGADVVVEVNVGADVTLSIGAGAAVVVAEESTPEGVVVVGASK